MIELNRDRARRARRARNLRRDRRPARPRHVPPLPRGACRSPRRCGEPDAARAKYDRASSSRRTPPSARSSRRSVRHCPGRDPSSRELGHHVERGVAEQITRALTEDARAVVGVVELARLQRERHPHPMHDDRSSRTPSSNRMRSSSCAFHARDSRAQSAAVGVRCSGSVASAARISSSVRPTRCATRMNATLRNTSRAYRRCPPGERVGATMPSAS